MAAIILRKDLENKKDELVNKYNMLVMSLNRIERDKEITNNEAIRTKGMIDLIDEQIAALDKEDEKIAKVGKEDESRKITNIPPEGEK